MKSPSIALPSELIRLSPGRISNRTIILVALGIYALVSWMILNGADNPPIRFRFDATRLVEASLVLKLHVGGALAMAVTAISSFFLTGLNGNQFSWIHGLSAWALIGLPMGIAAARRKDIARHRKHMTGMFTGGMLVAGLFTFLPGRMMWSIFFAA